VIALVATLAVALLAQGRGGRIDRADESPLIGTNSVERAHWEVAEGSVEVGEPFEARLIVEHPAGARASVDASALDADSSWVALAPPRLVPEQDAGTFDAERTLWRWTIASLEPGARDLPALEITLEEPDGGKRNLAVDAAQVAVASALAPDEDAPRPAKEFRPVEPLATTSTWTWILAGCVVLLALAVAVLVWALMRRKPALAAPPSSLARIEALAQRDMNSPDVVRALHYELTALLREHVDREQRAPRSALTDEEWLPAAREQLGADAAEELAEILRASRAVKYGPEVPTQWAVSEVLERAKFVVCNSRAPAQVAA